MYPPLPKLEACTYVVLWVLFYVWSIVHVCRMSITKDYIRHGVSKNYLLYTKEYYIPNPFKDVTDIEWNLWNYRVLEKFICSHTVYFFVMRLSEWIVKKHRFHISMMFSVGFCLYFYGLKGFLFILFQSLTCFSVAYFGESLLLTWIASVLSIFAFYNSYVISQLRTLFDNDDYILASFMIITSTCSLRYIAFSIEYCWNAEERRKKNLKFVKEKTNYLKTKQKWVVRQKTINLKRKQNLKLVKQKTVNLNTQQYSILDLLVYQFYFPLLAGGPVVNFDDFANQIQKEPVTWTIQFAFEYLFGICRYAFWHIFIDCALHYCYFSSMNRDIALMKTVSLFTLSGLALSFGQFFCMKYMVLYGLPSKIATGDNIDVPGPSHCLPGKHKFTLLWKYFDKGLHKWLVRYIFIPLGGSGTSLIQGTFTSMLVFAFVYLWHGMRTNHLWWAAINWFGVYIEKVANDVYKMKPVQEFERKYLSPAMSRRLRACLSTPLTSLLITSNLYFVAGVESTNVYMVRIYTEDLISTIIIHLVLYCSVQSSMEFSRLGI